MNQHHGTRSMARARPWWLGAGLCLCALVVWAHDSAPPPQPTPQPAPQALPSIDAEQLQDSLRQLNRQVGQLRQASRQAHQAQVGQGDGLQRQMVGIERSQHLLDTQLHALHAQNLQQIDALQSANRRLVNGLWTLAGIVALLMLLLWRQRTANLPAADLADVPPPPPLPEPPFAATTPLPASGTTTVTEPAPASEPDATPALSLAASSSPTTPPPDPQQALWSALVAADLRDTEQAFAQAHKGFMHTARIDS